MKLTYENGEQYFMKFNQVFHLSLAVSLLPFGLLFLARKKGFEVVIAQEWLWWSINIILPVIIVWLVYTAQQSYRRAMGELDKDWSLRQKLDFYYEISFNKYLRTGAATVLVVLGYALYDGFLFVGLYVAILFYLSLSRPSERNMERAMRLSNEEKKVFRDREGRIG